MISCSIDLSNECQNSCKFCLSKPFLKKGQYLDLGIYSSLLNDLASMNVKSIVFSGGGEPLTHPNFREFILLADAYHFKLGLITNGINLNQYLDLMSRFVFVKISLDAGSRKTYNRVKGSDSFNLVIQNVIKVIGKTFINIGYVLTEENTHELFDIEYLLNGVEIISIKRDVRKQPRIATVNSCKISDSLGIVTADANVYYCPLKRWDPNFLLGNLKSDSIINIWKRRAEIKPKVITCGDCRFSTIKHEGFI